MIKLIKDPGCVWKGVTSIEALRAERLVLDRLEVAMNRPQLLRDWIIWRSEIHCCSAGRDDRLSCSLRLSDRVSNQSRGIS
jgi:hypothetical protein